MGVRRRRRGQRVGGVRDGVDRAAAPAHHAGLHRGHGLHVSVGGEGGGHGDVPGQQVGVGGVRRGGRSVLVGVRGRGRQHHAVELGDVGGEAVHHAADLVHQGALGALVQGHQAPVAPGDHRARAGGAAAADAAATSTAAAAAAAARVLGQAGHLGVVGVAGRQPLAHRADGGRRLRPVGDGVALLGLRQLVQGLVCDRVLVAGQRGHGGQGGQRHVRGKVGPAQVALLGRLGEGLDDGRLVVLLLLDVEGEALPQVVAPGTAALRLRPGHGFTIGAGDQKGSGREDKKEKKQSTDWFYTGSI